MSCHRQGRPDSFSGYGVGLLLPDGRKSQCPKGLGGTLLLDDAIMAYEQQQVDLHALVWVRFDGKVESDEDTEPLQEQTTDGMVTKLYWSGVDVKYLKSDCPVHSYNQGELFTTSNC